MTLPTECIFGQGEPFFVRAKRTVMTRWDKDVMIPEGAVTIAWEYDALSGASAARGFVCAWLDPWHYCSWASVNLADLEVISKEDAILALLEQDGILKVLG